jgi:hypothetical protein
MTHALDRIRLRHATRLFDADKTLSADDLTPTQAQDILASRVFGAVGTAAPKPSTS